MSTRSRLWWREGTSSAHQAEPASFQGRSFHCRHTLDGATIRITPIYAPIPLGVAIDIAPKSNRNRVRPGHKVSVAVFGSDNVDVETIDPFSLGFGPGRAGPERHNGDRAIYRFTVEDLNGDAFDDVIFRFEADEAEIPADATEACLTGTVAGESFEACDDVDVEASH